MHLSLRKRYHQLFLLLLSRTKMPYSLSSASLPVLPGMPLLVTSPGQWGNFVFAGLQVFLFVLLAMFAYLSKTYPGLKVPSILFLLVLVGCVGLGVAGISVLSVLPPLRRWK